MSATKRPITANDLWAIRRVGAPVAVPGADAVVYGVTTYDVAANKGKDRLWIARPGAEPRALTAPEHSSKNAAVSADGRQLAFTRTAAGGDKPQVHVMPLDGGEARAVGDFPLGVRELRWLPDGRLVVLANVYQDAPALEATRARVTEREKDKDGARPHVTEDRLYRFWDEWLTDGAVPHLYVVDVATGEARDLTPDAARWFDFMEGGQWDVSPAGDEVVWAANSSVPPHDPLRWAIYAAPVGGGPTRCLTPDDPADDLHPRYSGDGRWIVYGRKQDPKNYADRVRLARIDRKTGAREVLTEGWDRSPSSWEVVPGTDTLIVQSEDRARSALFTIAVGAGAGTPKPFWRGDGSATAIAPAADGGVWVQHQSIMHPPEIARVRRAGAELERVTHVNDALLAELALGRVEEFETPGARGESVHSWIVYPPEFDAKQRWPLVHLIHGGPYGVHGDSWHFRWNQHTLIAPGYVGVLVNFHGSSSFGEAWANSILGDWGGKAADDILHVTDALIARGFIDETRMAITGGSFGGYMTAWLATRTDRFKTAIAHAAVFDLPAMYATDVTQGFDHELGGAPWGGPEARAAIDRWNPAAHTHAYQTPMLVIHGERDYRVPVTQGLMLYGILKARGIPARLVYYADENHMILKPKNSLHWYGEFLGWLERTL